MSAELFMAEFNIDPEALVRLLESRGVNRQNDEDLGYGIHVWLTAAFGAFAPKPFRILRASRQGTTDKVLGYTCYDRDALADQLATYADPSVYSVCGPEDIATKPMPLIWKAGNKLGFEVLVCPITRNEGREKDVYLRKAEEQGQKASLRREDVYQDWLSRQLSEAADLTQVRLKGFRLIKMYRRDSGRRAASLVRPQVLLAGGLRIKDDDAFLRTIRRGVGRHRAFGYGMLLLRRA